MSKVAQYLQQHLVGEVMTSADAREYFSTDASVFKILPQIIVYPRSENDVRKTARFAWQLAERGRVVPITARGLGTDLGGAAIGSGVILAFPAHMNKILSLNTKKRYVTVQPGLNYSKLQQTLHTHGLFLPPFPTSLEYSTLGGAISNNAAGEKSVKYGTTREYVKSLRAVLANGEVIEVKRLNKKDVHKKMGLATFEGEIYRTLDALISENKNLISKIYTDTTKNNSGYNVSAVKAKDGSMDLTPLIVGSQGTLAVVTEATIELENYNPKTSVLVGFFDSIASAGKAISELRKLIPSSLELIDENLLNFVDAHNPSLLAGAVPRPFSKLVLFIEFDNASKRILRKKTKKAKKILEKLATTYKQTKDSHEQEDLWKIRHAAAVVGWQTLGTKKSVPIIDDGIVPPEKLTEFLDRLYKLFADFNQPVAVWGHAGDANFHAQPFFDIGQVSDRQKMFKLMDAYYSLVIEMGGSTSGQYNDGRIRSPYIEYLYGPEIKDIFDKVKLIFDPYGILNPGIKNANVAKQDIAAVMRHEFNMNHLYDHMPRT
jgi:FAD/FMN-containing dehydrogenase